jgi:hypothetical protein
VVLTNCVISANSLNGPPGGGIWNNGSTTTLNNSIIWGNYATSANEIFGTVTMNNCCYANNIPGDIIDAPVTTACITLNPEYVNAATGDFRIVGISPCADAGDNTKNNLTTDIRGTGFGRKLLKTDAAQAGPIDMGAYEYKNGFDPPNHCANPTNGGEIEANQTICSGTSPAEITNKTTPTGNTGTLEYKWQHSIQGNVTGFNDIIPAVTADSLIPNALSVTTWYKRLAKVTCGSTWLESNVIEITVDPVSVGGNVTGGTNVCTGSNSTSLSLGGYTGNIIKWQMSTDNWTTPVDVANTTNALLASDLTATTKYRAIVQSGVCEADTSADATITVTPLSTPSVSIAITSGSNPVCAGNSVTFTATPVNGGTPPTYLWYLNGSLIAGGVSYTFIPVHGDQVYAVMESSLPCITAAQVTSGTETMVVNDAVAIASVDIAAYGNPDHSVTYTANPHNGGTPTYQWYKNGIQVGTGSTYTTSPVLSDEVYVVMYSSLTCVVPVTSLSYCTH